MRIKQALACGAALLSVSGCQTMTGDMLRTNSNIACGATGVGLGVLLASRSDASDLESALAGLGAAAVCRGLAELWANELDKRDQEQLALATEQAATSGETQSFSNPESGVKASVRVISEEQPVRVVNKSVPVLKDKVAETPPLTLVNKPFQATSVVNLRGGPGTDYKVVGSLSAGEVRQIVGQVKGEPWYLASEGGAGAGYVHTSLMKPSASEAPRLAASGPVASVEVQTEVQCKTVRQEVTLAGQSEPQTKDLKVCQQDDGTWKVA